MGTSPNFAYVDLDNLQFDPDNPRLPSHIDGGSESAVLEFMLKDASLEGLMRSIAQQGFFPGEPLLISQNTPSNATQDADSEEAPTYTVVEGNRRLAACKLLADPAKAPTQKKLVQAVSAISSTAGSAGLPCLIFRTREEVLAHLGYRHVTGIKEWDPLAKARFLRQYFDKRTGSNEDPLRVTARSIGSRSDYVGRLLTALALYERMAKASFYGMEGLDEESVSFSLIASTLAYAHIVKYLELSSAQDFKMENLNEDNWQFLAKVIFEKKDGGRTQLGESRNIKLLADVLSNNDAAAELRIDGASLEKVYRKHISTGTFVASLIDAEDSIQAAISNMPENGGTKEDRERVSRIVDSASHLMSLINSASIEAE